MSRTLHQQPQQIIKTSPSRRLLKTVCILALTAAILGGAVVTYQARAAQATPSTTGNFLVDQDHSLPFSQNKQNEPAITRLWQDVDRRLLAGLQYHWPGLWRRSQP